MESLQSVCGERGSSNLTPRSIARMSAHAGLRIRVAECVVGMLMSGRDQRLFETHAFVVMANHIHVLMTPLLSIAKITRRVKGATARQANLLLGLTGHYFWQDESFDHWVRTPGEWQKIRNYIEQNPVKAGLVARAEEWPWSSASHPPK